MGTIDDAVVGYAIVALHQLHDGRPVGHLTDLYVMPEARGVGVGDRVASDSDEPRRNRCPLGVVPLAPLPCTDEHLLGDVFRIGCVAERPQRQRVDQG